jgi:N6-L-threonylcarbamoyladenine synthase
MRILAIETSCDETAVSIIEVNGGAENPAVSVLAEGVLSQLDIHAHWGGVVPNIAKREHQRALTPLLRQTLEKAGLAQISNFQFSIFKKEEIEKILERETELLPEFLKFIESTVAPDIDAIAVTHGPGLEPALWVGVNCARALSIAWQKPIISCEPHGRTFCLCFVAKQRNF